MKKKEKKMAAGWKEPRVKQLKGNIFLVKGIFRHK
jgi:hypothetical protein